MAPGGGECVKDLSVPLHARHRETDTVYIWKAMRIREVFALSEVRGISACLV